MRRNKERQRGRRGGRGRRMKGGREKDRKSFHDLLCLANTELNDLYCKTSQSHYDFPSRGSDVQCFVFSLHGILEGIMFHEHHLGEYWRKYSRPAFPFHWVWLSSMFFAQVPSKPLAILTVDSLGIMRRTLHSVDLLPILAFSVLFRISMQSPFRTM